VVGHVRSKLANVSKIAAFTGAFAATSFGVAAQAPQTLKFAYVLPASHYLWEQGAKGFTEAVTKATNGQVKFEYYPAAQLGKDKVAVLQSGLADVVMIIPSYTPDKLPLSAVSELPGFYSNSCEGTAKFWEITKPGGLLYEQELKPLGIRPLFAAILIPYRILTSSKQVSAIGDLAGQKIRANGGAMDKTVRALGAVPVRASSPELYDAVSRGTVDGALFTLNALEQYSLQQVLKHMVEGPQLGSAGIIFAMSEKGWNALPDNVKEAMTKAAETSQKELCKWMDNDERQVREKFVSAGTMKPATLSADEVAVWQKRVSTVASEWAKELDSVGKKGTALLEAFRNAKASQ
jgi:TRAP-type C4-dicarboxylate transport system substrate-binding protein